MNREHLGVSYRDGYIQVYSVHDFDKNSRCYAHDVNQTGSFSAVFSRDSRFILTSSTDKILRRLDWKYTSTGRRVAIDATETAENFAASLATNSQDSEYLKGVPDVTDAHDDPAELALSAQSIKVVEAKAVEDVYITEKAEIIESISHVSRKLQELIEDNETKSAIERLDRDEFILDFEKRDKLMNELENEMQKIIQNSNEENIKQRIIKSRLIVLNIDIETLLGLDGRGWKIVEIIPTQRI